MKWQSRCIITRRQRDSGLSGVDETMTGTGSFESLDVTRVGPGVRNPSGFAGAMPLSYFDHVGPEFHGQHELFLDYFRGDSGEGRVFSFQGDSELFILHNFDAESIRRHLGGAVKSLRDRPFRYRSFVNNRERFVIHQICSDFDDAPGGTTEGRQGDGACPDLGFGDCRRQFVDDQGRVFRHVAVSYDEKSGSFLLNCVNVAHQTLLSNLWEIFYRHLIDVDFVQVERVFDCAPRVRTYYRVVAHCVSRVSERDVASVQADFERYIRHFTITMSLFDLVGPAMVGPSSSHTAGANRIGQIARAIILAKIEQGETVSSVGVRLVGSFADTGVGHKTPVALGGGLCGVDADDEGMLSAGSIESLQSVGIDFGGRKASFDGFVRGTDADLARYAEDRCGNIAEIIFRTDRGEYTVTGFSIGAGNVEVRYFNGRLVEPINGKHDFFLDGDRIVSRPDAGRCLPVIRRIFDAESPRDDYVLRFNSFEELIDYCRDHGFDLLRVVMDVESAYQRATPEELEERMLMYWARMKASVKSGVHSRAKSMFGLSGDGAFRMGLFLKENSLFDNLYGRAAAYATAVNEVNARGGVIVACPTAGSCGILPGVLVAYQEATGASDDRIVQALMISGFLGMLLFSDVSTSGAAYGCQAEIGSAAAMAAAALCFLEGGDVETTIAGFILAIKNSLGLICDPVAGLVEVPCVKRNGIYSSVAITAAMMALSGVKSFVSPDEVILTMREVGEKLSSDYKETARGGLARTRDGKHVERMFAAEVRRFFGGSDD